MHRFRGSLPIICLLLLALGSAMVPFPIARSFAANDTNALVLSKSRHSAADLAIGGELAGLPPGKTRYISWPQLLRLPQFTSTVRDDANFTKPTVLSGVLLQVLAQSLGAAPQSDMVIALCNDRYLATYPRAYLSAHHPFLVLLVNGRAPDQWPKDPVDHRYDMGPFLISHASFKPSFKILAHADEAQIPWGVVRLEFRDENAVFGTIAPRGPHAGDATVQAGFRIAQQNCFRCHNMGNEGGRKAGVPWIALAQLAATSPKMFASYVRNPLAMNPKAKMPGNPNYDDATISAIAAYFQTFLAPKTP